MAREHGSLVTVRDLLPLLPEDATEEELVEAISSEPSLRSRFELRSGYLTERAGESEADLAVAEELTNRRLAQANVGWAVRFVPRLRSTDFIMVAASGSTSYRSASKSRDLDLFCVAPTGRLWTSITRGLIAARTHGILHPDSPDICFSCVMDQGFAANTFGNDQGPLFARDALETVVLRGGPSYRELLEEAKWISAFYPNAYSAKLKGFPDGKTIAARQSTISRVAELFLFRVVSAYIRAKSAMLNARLARRGQTESLFAVRSGPDHLIYESRRYSRLKERYSSGIAKEPSESMTL